MIVNSKHYKALIRARSFAAVFLTLLVAATVFGYLGYLSFARFQADENALQSKFNELSSRYSSLQANYSELLKNNVTIESRIADIESKFATLQSQQNILQSNDSMLQAEYARVVDDYQKLKPINPFSYAVFTDGKGNYYAQNGSTNAIDYSGKDLASILNTVIGPGRTCYLLPGLYSLNSSVNVFGKNCTSISGGGIETTLIEVTSDVCAFNITGTSSVSHNKQFSISNIAINSTVSSTQPAIFIKHMDDVKLDDISVTRFSVGYDIEATQKVNVESCKVWSNAATFSTGFRFVGYSIDIFLIDTTVLHNQSKGTGYSFKSCDSVVLTNAVANPTLHVYGRGGYGFLFVSCHFVNLIGTISDGNGDHGYYFSGGFRYCLTGAWAGSNYGSGLQSDNAGQIILLGCSFYTNHMDGIKLTGSNGTSISTVISIGNSQYGLEVSNTCDIMVTASILTQNGFKGIFFDAGNTLAIIQNDNCMSNLDSSFDIYISTHQTTDSFIVSNNLGRIYQEQ